MKPWPDANEVVLVDKNIAILGEGMAVDEVVLVGKNLVKNLAILGEAMWPPWFLPAKP